MRRKVLKKILCMSLLSVSLLGITSVGASASWRQSSGKWYYYYNDGTMAINTTTPDGFKVGADGVWIQNNIPITAPSTWTRLTNDGYVLKNGSVLAYKPKDLQGYSYEQALMDMGSAIINNKKNSNVNNTYQKYNGHPAMRYEYMDTSNDGKAQKNCFIVVATNTKLYGFMLLGDNDYNFDLDKIDLEYVLNTTLNV
ncbi:hypothetical protein GKZ28_13060 [Clostridium chromiireducens]|uniref:Cell wall-binding protein n=1 Tax=Clostridium chromiireducens TaxID=225345 RepID=A0A964RMZ8_9CLOT|nr:hypothetical protein [Clostridium chromiireducens]MVX64622.1 hypothetical protein [Clostridium chromiireducens]